MTVSDPLDGKPWDLSKPAKRRRALQIMRERKPALLIGSPECKQFSITHETKCYFYASQTDTRSVTAEVRTFPPLADLATSTVRLRSKLWR